MHSKASTGYRVVKWLGLKSYFSVLLVAVGGVVTFQRRSQTTTTIIFEFLPNWLQVSERF